MALAAISQKKGLDVWVGIAEGVTDGYVLTRWAVHGNTQAVSKGTDLCCRHNKNGGIASNLTKEGMTTFVRHAEGHLG